MTLPADMTMRQREIVQNVSAFVPRPLWRRYNELIAEALRGKPFNDRDVADVANKAMRLLTEPRIERAG